MPKGKDKMSISYAEIESSLYSIINTILNLYEKYKNGNLENNFFQKSIKNSMNELLKINFQLKEHNISLSHLLKKMQFSESYYQAIDIINTISELRFPKITSKSEYKNTDKYKSSISSSILEIPGVTANITSSFITLMDAIKLNALDNKNVVKKLFIEVEENLHKFPGLELIQIKFKKLFKNVLDNYSKFVKDNKFRDLIADDLYKLYREFQDKLNLVD